MGEKYLKIKMECC